VRQPGRLPPAPQQKSRISERRLEAVTTLKIMRLMAWLFTVPLFGMFLLFAAVLLNEGFERTMALYRRAYLPRPVRRGRHPAYRTTSPFNASRSRESGIR
jgi:hypothetical protein